MVENDNVAIITKLHTQLITTQVFLILFKTGYKQLEAYKTKVLNDLKEKEIVIQTLERNFDKLREKFQMRNVFFIIFRMNIINNYKH